jgi:hypothetical protein
MPDLDQRVTAPSHRAGRTGNESGASTSSTRPVDSGVVTTTAGSRGRAAADDQLPLLLLDPLAKRKMMGYSRGGHHECHTL